MKTGEDSDCPPPLVSVIVVNYNHRRYLSPCLRSVLASTYPRLEVIVVDNGSTDGSTSYITNRFPEVRIVHNGNGGYGQGNNKGAMLACGELLAFLNPDTQVAPDWLDQLVTALEAHPGAGLATPKILMLKEPERINACGNAVHLTGLALCRGLNASRQAFARTEEVSAVSGAAFVIWKDVFHALGGFDETFFLYMEDTDLSLRARLAGYPCLYVPHAAVYHDYTLRFGADKTFYQERNRYLMLLKTLHWPTLLMLGPALFLAEVITWSFTLLRNRQQLGDKWRAYRWLIDHRQQVLHRRRQTQVLRAVSDRALLQGCESDLAFAYVSDGWDAWIAQAILNPLFLALHRVAMATIWW